MKQSNIFIFLTFFVVGLMTTVVALFVQTAVPNWARTLGILGILGVGMSSYWFLLQRYSLPRQINVAIVGFPRSGKTTLIITIFRETFQGRLSPLKLTPRGRTTIEKVNADVQRLDTGYAVGPTTDQELFAFRADVTTTRVLFARTYTVQFGDFPGKSSERFSSKDKETWLHTSEYFKWVSDSDAMVFVIDLAEYLLGGERRKEYVSRMSSAIRAAWHNYLDVNHHRLREVRQHPLVVVFTKTDLLTVESSLGDGDLEERIESLGFGDKIPPDTELRGYGISTFEDKVKREFAELIDYLKSEDRRFSIVFTSGFGQIEGRRLGIMELVRAVLPS